MEFRSSLAGWFCWDFPSCSQMSARAEVTWRHNWDWKIHFQGGSLTWQASWCWLLSGGLSSPSHVPLCRIAWVSLQHGGHLPPGVRDPRHWCGSAMPFMTYLWKSYTVASALFHSHLMWGGATQGHDAISGSHLGDWLPHPSKRHYVLLRYWY